MAATREPDIAQKQLSGVDVAGKTFKVHLDGYDQRDLLAGGPNGAAFHALWPEELVQGGFYDLGRRQHVIPPGPC